jgi:hypothetical protein
MYRASPEEGPFRQGEILSSVVQYAFDPATGEVQGILHEYAVLAAQDCDLERAHEASGDEPLNGALLFPASPVAEGRENAGINSKIWSYTKTNANERYQVLQAIDQDSDRLATGIPDLLVDFRKYFTLSYSQLAHQLGEDLRRRAFLLPPYREHFQARAVAYLARVPLDPVHQISVSADTQEKATPQSDAAATQQPAATGPDDPPLA